MFSKYKNQQSQETLRALRQRLGQAAGFRFPNKTYEKGWQDCLKFLGQSIRKETREVPVTKARQQSLTTRTTGHSEETELTAE